MHVNMLFNQVEKFLDLLKIVADVCTQNYYDYPYLLNVVQTPLGDEVGSIHVCHRPQ